MNASKNKHPRHLANSLAKALCASAAILLTSPAPAATWGGLFSRDSATPGSNPGAFGRLARLAPFALASNTVVDQNAAAIAAPSASPAVASTSAPAQNAAAPAAEFVAAANPYAKKKLRIAAKKTAANPKPADVSLERSARLESLALNAEKHSSPAAGHQTSAPVIRELNRSQTRQTHEQLRQEGLSAAHSGDLQTAERRLALAVKNGSAAASLDLAVLAALRLQDRRAFDILLSFEGAHTPQSAALFTHLSKALDDPSSHLARMQSASPVLPGNARPMALGAALLSASRFSEAASVFKRSAVESSERHAILGWAVASLADGNPDEAERAADMMAASEGQAQSPLLVKIRRLAASLRSLGPAI